jgi:uncharacterized protein
MHVIDREAETAALQRLAEAGSRKLALVYGRRRIGKTYLLNSLWPRERLLYFTASATSPAINRRVLIEEAALWSGEELRAEDYPTWRSVFKALFSLAPDRDLVMVLDEFQYLATDGAGLREVASELNAVWESRGERSGGLLLVLSGSEVATLESLNRGGAPLYGRLDATLQLQPFDYYDAAAMISDYDAADRIRGYSAFGGVPTYLRAIDTVRPLEDNIVDLLLSPRGEVRLQLETVLTQEEGLRDVVAYQGILGAVGLKRRTRGEIAAATGRALDSSLRRMIGQLVELGYLGEETGFEESPNQGLRYRIVDPALRFHHGLVLPNESAIASAGAATVWRERLAAQVFPTHVGGAFEDVVRQAYVRFAAERELPAVERWGRWDGQDRAGESIEVDLAARLLDGRMLTGSAKFRRRRTNASALHDHVDALHRLAASGRGWARDALAATSLLLFVSAAGYTQSFRRAAAAARQPVLAWDLGDLF